MKHLSSFIFACLYFVLSSDCGRFLISTTNEIFQILVVSLSSSDQRPRGQTDQVVLNEGKRKSNQGIDLVCRRWETLWFQEATEFRVRRLSASSSSSSSSCYWLVFWCFRLCLNVLSADSWSVWSSRHTDSEIFWPLLSVFITSICLTAQTQNTHRWEENNKSEILQNIKDKIFCIVCRGK